MKSKVTYGTSFLKSATILVSSLVILATTVYADRPAKEELRETVPVRDSNQAIPQPIPAATGCYTRASAGQTVWFFSEEDDSSAPGAYFDFWCADTPLNYRIGIEGRHLDISQSAAQQYADPAGEAVEVTYIRIPISLEYYHDLGEGFTWYFGGGPDLLNVVNDISEFDVGGHLSTRVHYAFDENWGVALEAGYMWNRLEMDNNKDLDLDGAYITPTLAYTF